jgi:hypothetical protein
VVTIPQGPKPAWTIASDDLDAWARDEAASAVNNLAAQAAAARKVLEAAINQATDLVKPLYAVAWAAWWRYLLQGGETWLSVARPAIEKYTEQATLEPFSDPKLAAAAWQWLQLELTKADSERAELHAQGATVYTALMSRAQQMYLDITTPAIAAYNQVVDDIGANCDTYVETTFEAYKNLKGNVNNAQKQVAGL